MNKMESPIALEVRAFLARTKLSQMRLATEAGINPVYVNRLVTGATKDVWSRTADALRAAMGRLEEKGQHPCEAMERIRTQESSS